MTHPVIATIYRGYVIKTDSDDLLVCASQKIRGTYRYVCRNRGGQMVSVRREDLLQAQRDGDARVVYPA